MTTPATTSPAPLASKVEMQHRLFAELSRMFGVEVPLYDKSLLVNRVCNSAVCELLSMMFAGFRISAEQIDKSGGERHGAIRLGKPSEYRLMCRFFAAFAMEPHNFYDMTSVGEKDQPVIATAFRSRHQPEHRVFASLLQADYFEPTICGRIEALLESREVFSSRARELLDTNERRGGLDWNDANALIREGCDSIFKWRGTARDFALYTDLCDSGFKIAADVACFESHHLNHLTPNTFCMDLYTAAMKFCLGEIPETELRSRATRALTRLLSRADHDFLRLQFKHFTQDEIDGFKKLSPSAGVIGPMVSALADRLRRSDLNLTSISHAGFKDLTEGPSEDTPVLLRQDAYRALSEPVLFRNADGSAVKAVHTARFGEIEQRAYACTPKGRALYDMCLAQAEALMAKNSGLPESDFAAYEALYAEPFAPFPKTLPELLRQGLVHGRYCATPSGKASAGRIATTDVHELVKQGHVRVDGLRYEDFLPVSAAGIFASNLNQYGTKSTAAVKPTYTQAMLEDILGRPIIDAAKQYAAVEAESLIETYRDLGLTPKAEWIEKARAER
jgi:uncharacterized glyoxalase superfamily metalloenzyme YdcJ